MIRNLMLDSIRTVLLYGFEFTVFQFLVHSTGLEQDSQVKKGIQLYQ